MHGIMVPHSSCGDSRPRLSGGAKLRSLCSLYYAPSFNLDAYDRQWWTLHTGELALAGQPRAAIPTFFLGLFAASSVVEDLIYNPALFSSISFLIFSTKSAA